MGSEVFDVKGELLGILADVLPTSANDVWVVKSERFKDTEMLIPALSTVVKDVDIDGRKIVVELPAGLREIYEG